MRFRLLYCRNKDDYGYRLLIGENPVFFPVFGRRDAKGIFKRPREVERIVIADRAADFRDRLLKERKVIQNQAVQREKHLKALLLVYFIVDFKVYFMVSCG